MKIKLLSLFVLILCFSCSTDDANTIDDQIQQEQLQTKRPEGYVAPLPPLFIGYAQFTIEFADHIDTPAERAAVRSHFFNFYPAFNSYNITTNPNIELWIGAPSMLYYRPGLADTMPNSVDVKDVASGSTDTVGVNTDPADQSPTPTR